MQSMGLMNGFSVTLAMVFVLLFWGGCGESPQGEIVVRKAWVRENIPPQKITAAYLVLQNAGDAASLVSAQTNVAEVTEIHVVTARENVMQMKKVDALPLPAGGMATLQPGGNHLMLIGLHRDLKPGEMVDLSLRFDTGQTATVQAVVKAVGDDS